MRVLVTGASGYLGSRIVPELLHRGHEVVASGTGKAPPDAPWVDQAEWRQVDVFDLRVLAAALADVDAVVYLIHGLGDVDFSRMDREAAENMRDAVDLAGVRRVVYFSGIVPDVSDEELSEHLRSRLEVEEILAQSHASTLALRAAIVVGAGSTSFEVVRQISERLPLVQTIPTWMRDTVVQPIAVADAVRYVAEAVERTDVTGHLDVAGPDRVTYPELLDLYADAAGLTRVQVPVPGHSGGRRRLGGGTAHGRRHGDGAVPAGQPAARHGGRPRPDDRRLRPVRRGFAERGGSAGHRAGPAIAG